LGALPREYAANRRGLKHRWQASMAYMPCIVSQVGSVLPAFMRALRRDVFLELGNAE